MMERIKQISYTRKLFLVGMMIGIIFLGGVAFSESIFQKKIIDLKKVEKILNFKFGGIERLKEVKEEKEKSALTPQECEEKARREACWRFMGQADPNEKSQEICDVYLEAGELIAKGKKKEAKILLEKAIVQFPESRHLHYRLAETLWYLYDEKNPDPTILKKAIEEAEKALEIGISFGKVDYHITSLLSRLLAEAKDVKTLDRIFGKILATKEGWRFYPDYIKALIKLDDPRTEKVLKKAIEIEERKRKEGIDVAGSMVITYAEWLLDHGREEDVLNLPIINSPYMYFYRGVALERLNRLDEARTEYFKYTHFYPEHIPPLPMPRRFQIPGSKLQKEMEIRFEGKESGIESQSSSSISEEQAIKGLSYLIFGEAGGKFGETIGGKRAVGWIVRNRVLRGSVDYPPCPYVDNTGATLAEKYKSVMCQSGQFNGMCKEWCENPDTIPPECNSDEVTDQVAYEVYYGYAPDPVSPHCPGGIINWGGSYCSDTTNCYGYKDTYRLAGPLFNYGTSGACPSHSCAPDNKGKVCGNGGLDNCFYSNPIFCVGSGCVTYSGSLNEGQCGYTDYYYTSVNGYHKGHLEGPESYYNLIDFDLYLLKWINGSWQTVDYSIRYGSVDDVNYYGTPGYYIWAVCAYKGNGSLMLYTSRP